MCKVTFVTEQSETAFNAVMNAAKDANKSRLEIRAEMDQCKDAFIALKNETDRDRFYELRGQLEKLDWCDYPINWFDRHQYDHELVIGLDYMPGENDQFPDFLWCINNEKGQHVINGGLINHGSDSEPRYQSHT